MLNRVVWVVVASLAVPAVLAAGGNGNFTFGAGQLCYENQTVPPAVRCVGGEETGTFPPCTDGTVRIFGRAEQQIWFTDQVSPSTVGDLVGGLITFVVNCNFNAQYRGPCWGTFTWDVDGQGNGWEGQWTAPLMDLMTYESEISMVGFGVGGPFDGSHLKLDGYSNPGDWCITFTVRIKD